MTDFVDVVGPWNDNEEWPGLPNVLNQDAHSVQSSAGFEVLSASEESFSLASLDGSDLASDGWHQVDSDALSLNSDWEDECRSYLQKVLAPGRSETRLVRTKRRPFVRKTQKKVSLLPVMEEMDGFEKPMSDILLMKKEGKHCGLDGHTGRKGCGCRNCREQLEIPATLERDKDAKMQNNSFGYLADVVERDTFGSPLSRLQEPYPITAFELHGGDTSYSLGRSNAWDALPELLAEHAVAAPQHRTLPNGAVQTSFLLEPVGEFLPSSAVAAAQHALKYHIYTIQRHKPKLWVKLASEPPEGVCSKQLKTLLRCRAGKVPQEAVVRCNHPAHAWDIRTARGYPLDIDLGSTCEISHFSTQGRHPVTRRYPHCGVDPVTRQPFVEDEENFNLKPGQRYKGPWWTVKSDKSDYKDHRQTQVHREWLEPSWVSKYELWSRGDEQGSAWSCVGVFAGNCDATAEVAHAFEDAKSGLRARYLRVVPLTTEGGGALRVGVYGEEVALRGQKAARGMKKSGGGEEGVGVVTYTLTQGQREVGAGGCSRNTRFARDRNAPIRTGGGWYEYDSDERRRRMAFDLRQETKEYGWGGEWGCLEVWPKDVDSDDGLEEDWEELLAGSGDDDHAELSRVVVANKTDPTRTVTLLDCVQLDSRLD